MPTYPVYNFASQAFAEENLPITFQLYVARPDLDRNCGPYLPKMKRNLITWALEAELATQAVFSLPSPRLTDLLSSFEAKAKTEVYDKYKMLIKSRFIYSGNTAIQLPTQLFLAPYK